MKKANKLVTSLLVGLGCLTAGVFALSSPTATAATADSEFQCEYSATTPGTSTVLDSEYSAEQTYGATQGTLLNNCESVGGWVQAANTPTLSTSNVFEGSHSIEITFSGWSWFNVRVLESSPDLATLQATYSTITFNVYSNYEGLNLYLGNGVQHLALLSQGDNVVTINTADLTTTLYAYDSGGYFLSFFVGGASTIRIDNFVGKTEPAVSTPSANQLATPVVSISSSGLASWEAVSGASGYVVKLNGVEGNRTSDLSVQLSSGDTIQVKATGSDETSKYGASAITQYTQTQAMSIQLPSGYSDNILSVERIGESTNKGALLNFSSLQIPTSKLKSLTFRVFVVDEGIPDDYPEIRIWCTSTANWAMRFDARSYTNRWINITLDNQGKNFYGSHTFADLADSNGNLGKFELGLRSNADVPFYIDSITYELETEFPSYSASSFYNGASSLMEVDSATATTALIPSGFTDNVLIVDHGDFVSGKGVVFDFSMLKIPTSLLQTLTFRIYVTGDGTASNSYPSIRIPDGNTGSWVLLYDADALTDQWLDVTLKSDGTNFYSGCDFTNVSSNGYLDKVELLCRANSNVKFFIDSVTYTVADDIDIPQLIYSGEDTVYRTAGAPLLLDVSATDATQGTLEVEYLWNDTNAVNPDGTLNKGTYTLTLKASDYWKNTTFKQLTVVVGDPETVPPVINVSVTEMHLVTGTTPMLTPTATDNSGWATVAAVWSDGALDSAGKLTAGTHTYTITAIDPSQNKATKTITVYVTNTGNYQNVIDEQNPVSYTYYPNGGSGSAESDFLAKGDSVTLDDCMFTHPDGLTFKAWAIGSVSGEQKQPGESITLSANTSIYAIWNEHVHVYDSAWQKDESGHWKNCACGASDTVVEHTDVTTDTDHLCDDCGYTVGTHSYGSAWQKDENGHWKNCDCGASDTVVEHTDVTTDTDHLCDDCGYTLGGCTDSDNNHLCDTCGETLSSCADNDNDHKCDTCQATLSNCEDGDDNHLCDICNATLSTCEDKDNNHTCDTCQTTLSTCEDADNNHLCDTCGETVSVCEDTDDDHLCDTCGTELSSCADNDNDHKCDTCQAVLSTCEDNDNNHTCDTCQAVLSICEDTDDDHLCDTCGETLSSCADNDNNHLCDTCQATLSNCEDSDDNHLCDTCDATLSTCEDKDNNHTCDICQAVLSPCEDTDGDHLCDTCGETVSVCEDTDDDHLCDICGETLSSCEDNDNDHLCDTCGETVSECLDEDNNHLCDICGEPYGTRPEQPEEPEQSEQPDPPEEPEQPETPSNPPSSRGCGSAMGGGLSIISALATAFILSRKKKRD